MNKTTHLIGGLCVSTIASTIIYKSTGQASPSIAIVGACLIGSLFPDVDEPNSTIGRKLPFVSTITKFTLGHRGVVHTPLFALFSTFILYILLITFNMRNDIAIYISLGYALGFISHLLLDFLTPQGIMLMYPISRKYMRLFGLKGQIREIATSLVLLGITCVVIYLNKIV